MAHQEVTNRHRSTKTRRAKDVRKAKAARDIPRLRIARGDIVMIIAGDDKGSKGKVLMVIPNERRVIVEKINMVKRHLKPTQRNTQGGIQEKEAPIHVSNVQLVGKSGKPGRVGVQILGDGKDKRRERILRPTGETVPRAGR